MILDTSAVIAVLTQEPDAERYIEAMVQARSRRLSAGNYLELALVCEGQFGAEVLQQCDALLRRLEAVVEPVTQAQAQAARQAFHDFGKGRHPAGLNFGDCFAYALAKVSGEALLFKGDDFSRTDVSPALVDPYRSA